MLTSFACTVYNHVIRKSYDLIVEAIDANAAWARAEFTLGFPNLDQRTYVVRVRPL